MSTSLAAKSKASPDVDTNLPVFKRQWEKDYYDHHGWPYYWAGMGLANGTGISGSPWNPGNSHIRRSRRRQIRISKEAESKRAGDHDPHENDDVHLRSSSRGHWVQKSLQRMAG